jgi:serine/threonine protein kinase/tetratricopeptide (TPR) repeat protein
MNPEEIFHAALATPPSERSKFLAASCGGDEALRSRIEALLQAHENPGSFLADRPPVLGVTVDEPIREGPGTVIGPYKLLQQIGEGGMGIVYMAEQTHPVQRKVALKVIKPGMDSKQVIARFEAERQALALMDHVNIARVLDAGATEAGRPYFVMELVHGVPITKYCDDNRLTPRQRLELFVPVCQAIQHAHQKGIIHRDLKPSNVMITLYDGKPVPKVIDFGVAKATEQRLTERTLFTQYGTLVGTFEYMSPEQAETSALGADTRSDIFSLGVLLYELLTGSTPLSHKRLKEAAYAEILRMIKEEEPPRPSARLSDSGEALASISAQRHMEPAKLTKLVRGELDWIVMKCLEKDRNRRYETVNGFAADVQRYLNDEPVLACPPSAWYRFRKFARRNKAALVTASVIGLAVLLAVVALAVSIVLISREKDQKVLALDTALREKRRGDRNLAKAKKAVEDYLAATAGNPKLKSADFYTLRKELLATAIPFLEEFAREEGDDRQLDVDRAWAHKELAMVRIEMGDIEKALANCEQARLILARLATESPEVPGPRTDLADVHNNSGLLLAELGRLEAAEAQYRQALTLYEKLAADFPNIAAHQSDLAAAIHNLGSLEGKRGNREAWRHLLQQAILHAQAAVQADPRNGEYREFLANHHHNLGILLSDLGQWAEAEAEYQKARKLQEELASEFPDVARYRDHLASSYNSLADLLQSQGKLVEAESAYHQALAIQERLAGEFPSIPAYRQNLAGTLHNLGLLMQDLQKNEAAEAAFRKAVVLRQELVAAFPRLPHYRNDLASSYDVLGLLLTAKDKPAEAEAAFRQAIPILEKLTEELPGVPAYAVSLGSCYVNLGVRGLRIGEFKTALGWLNKAVATLEPVWAKDRRQVGVRQFLGNAHGARAEVLIRLDRQAEALKDWERTLELDDGRKRDYFRVQRALTLAHLKEHARATAEVDELVKTEKLPNNLRYHLACVFAVASAAVGDNAQLREQYARRAIELLRLAYEKGYKDQPGIKAEKNLDALRSREDFQKLLKEVETKQRQPEVRNQNTDGNGQ